MYPRYLDLQGKVPHFFFQWDISTSMWPYYLGPQGSQISIHEPVKVSKSFETRTDRLGGARLIETGRNIFSFGPSDSAKRPLLLRIDVKLRVVVGGLKIEKKL